MSLPSITTCMTGWWYHWLARWSDALAGCFPTSDAHIEQPARDVIEEFYKTGDYRKCTDHLSRSLWSCMYIEKKREREKERKRESRRRNEFPALTRDERDERSVQPYCMAAYIYIVLITNYLYITQHTITLMGYEKYSTSNMLYDLILYTLWMSG